MHRVLSGDSLEALFPFLIVIDRDWTILRCGRSLRRLFPEVLEGERLLDRFEVPALLSAEAASSPEETSAARSARPELLMHSIVVLERRHARAGVKIRLRGQVERTLDGGFMLAVTPVLTDLKEVRPIGLDFSDFSLFDPVFDFLVLMQSERRALQNSENDRRRLRWENRVSGLLHRLVLRSVEVEPAAFGGFLVDALSEVCRSLGLQFANFLWVSKDDAALIPAFEGELSASVTGLRIWHAAEPDRYSRFIAATEAMRFDRRVGLPGLAWDSAQVVWIDDVRSDDQFIRRESLQDFAKPVVGIGVPVMARGKVAAIIEFYSESVAPENRERLVEFFEILGRQIGLILERQWAAEQEKLHVAQLALTAKLSSLGEMSAGVAHEINNPLAVIHLMSSQLMSLLEEEGQSSPEVQLEMLRKLNFAAERIARIVRGLRLISRDATLDGLERVTLRSLIDDTLSFCQGRFQSHSVGLKVVLPEGGDIFLRANAVQVSQVLLNLLGNAFDAVTMGDGPEKWVRIEATVRNGSLELAVVDSGPGVPESVVDRIMQPFFTTKPIGKGTGLGLSISRGIIEAHGGRLLLDRSSPHTRFVIRLPLEGDQAARFGSSPVSTS